MIEDVRLQIRRLEDFIRLLDKDLPQAKVGIIGSKSSRSGDSTNVAIGIKHEFGDHEVPQRSFLRVPLQDNMKKFLENSGLINPELLDQCIQKKSLYDLVNVIGAVGRDVVLEGFASQGFGKWKDHAPGYTNRTGQVLVDTQQLRNSISYEVIG